MNLEVDKKKIDFQECSIICLSCLFPSPSVHLVSRIADRPMKWPPANWILYFPQAFIHKCRFSETEPLSLTQGQFKQMLAKVPPVCSVFCSFIFYFILTAINLQYLVTADTESGTTASVTGLVMCFMLHYRGLKCTTNRIYSPT